MSRRLKSSPKLAPIFPWAGFHVGVE
jgi:hypothetical protein